LVVLTGASGSGKTTIARFIQGNVPSTHEVIFFDSIGVPNQPGEDWQRATMMAWMEKVRPILSAGKSVLFEGQMRIAFIKEALAASQIPNARIILLDCDDATRQRRLTDRNQPDLANPTMLNWARYLREEALATGSEILDTGRISLHECVNLVRRHLGMRETTLEGPK
jgi:adenylate kinase family enzyme